MNTPAAVSALTYKIELTIKIEMVILIAQTNYNSENFLCSSRAQIIYPTNTAGYTVLEYPPLIRLTVRS